MTAPDFKSGVGLERGRGGFDSHPLPLTLLRGVLFEQFEQKLLSLSCVSTPKVCRDHPRELILVECGFAKCCGCGRREEQESP